MTRPRSAPIKGGVRYTVTVPKKLYEQWKKAAAADNRSPSAWMIPHLEEAVEEWERVKTTSDSLRPAHPSNLKEETTKIVQETAAPLKDDVVLSIIREWTQHFESSQKDISKTLLLLLDQYPDVEGKEEMEKRLEAWEKRSEILSKATATPNRPVRTFSSRHSPDQDLPFAQVEKKTRKEK